MAQNVTIAGNQYPSVPSVLIPKTGGGGNAIFADPSPVTASAADVLAGKYFLDSTGSITEGTGSGGGDVENYIKVIQRTVSSFVNSAVTTIGSYAFASCTNLQTVNLPEVSRIQLYAFSYCITLTTVAIPKCERLGSYAFRDCASMTTLNAPLLSSIGGSAFYACSGLTSVNLPSAHTLGSNCFQGCIRLTTISVPLLRSIYGSCFNACSSLTQISLPSLSSAYSNAFRSAYALQSVYLFNSVVASASTNLFLSTPMSLSSYLGYFGSIYVRSSLLASWKAATNWSLYADRMVGLTDAQIAALG